MPDAPKLETALRSAADVMLLDPAVYAIEATAPSFAVRPKSQEDVAALLAVAQAAGASVVPWGGGAQQNLGMPPLRYDIALDLRGLDKLVEYTPADLTVTVEAGMSLSKLQAELAKSGQWLPLDPPLPDEATVGGVLATNASGPARHRYGTARDLLIGITFALPNGDLAKSGGRVVKNVAGYDLGKLQIGALGTLGVITQATFKVAPLPLRVEEASATGEIDKIMSIISGLADALLAVQSMVLTDDDSAWRLNLRFAAGSAAVERSLRDFAAIVSRAGASLASVEPISEPAAVPWREAPLVARAAVIPTSVGQVCEAFRARGATVRAYPSAGIIYGAWEEIKPEAIRELRKLCVEAGRGALVLERAPLDLKRAAGVWGEPRGDLELMRRVKAEMDPHNVLNPGRYIGGI